MAGSPEGRREWVRNRRLHLISTVAALGWLAYDIATGGPLWLSVAMVSLGAFGVFVLPSPGTWREVEAAEERKALEEAQQ